MLVKIRDKVYNSEVEPIMVILTDEEKDLISMMDKNTRNFCSYPENLNHEEAAIFMDFSNGCR